MSNYIVRIAATGLKSGDFSHDLAKVNLFTGKSFSGKSSRIEAITLVLKRYLHALGKNGTMQLARNGQITVKATDDIHRTSEFEWTQKHKTGRIIRNEIPETPDVLTDSSVYFDLSDKKKIEYAFAMYDMGASDEFNGEAISASVKNIRLDENTKETESIVNEIVGIVDDTDQTRHENDQPIQQWLEYLIASLKERLSLAKQSCDRMTKTVQGITAIGATEVKVHRNPDAELKLERAKLGAVQGRLGGCANRLEKVDTWEKRKTELESQIATLPNGEVDLAAPLNQQVEAARKAVAAWEGPRAATETEQCITKVETELVALEQLLDGYQSKTGDLALSHLRSTQDLDQRVKMLKEHCAAMLEKETAHQKAMAVEHCVHCGAHHSDWSKKHSKELMDQWFMSQEILDKEKSGRLMEGIDFSKDAVATSLASLNASKILDEEHAVNARKKTQCNEWLGALRAVAKNEESGRNGLIRIARADLHRLTDERTRAMGAGENRTRLEAELDTIIRALSEGSRAEVELEQTELTVEKTTAETNIARLETAQREYTTSQADAKRSADALITHARDRADLDVTAAAIKVLEVVQARMVESAFGRILKTVNAVCDCIIESPIEYRGELGLGRFVNSTWIRHETFSGTERALIFAGISLALAESAPIKVILVDELGRMDPESLRMFLNRMINITESGMADQFVGCLSSEDFQMAGINIIRL